MVDTKSHTESATNSDPNLPVYNAPAVAQYYAALNYLTACEKILFESYLRPGMAILDLGVGGGRTTTFLSSIAARYVGVDYAAEMIAACRQKFPHLEFDVSKASDLSKFGSSSFDAVVMAFNGIDYVIPDESRFRALREIARVLKPEGILIFSSHNPKALWVRPSWNSQRLRAAALNIFASDSALFRPYLWLLTALRIMLGGLQSALQSLTRIARRFPTQAFWRGEGYWKDPAHGGLKTHVATPEKVTNELRSFGFRPLRVQGDDYPQTSGRYLTDWYYYVFAKAAATGEK